MPEVAQPQPERVEDQEMLRRALLQLPPRQRAVVVLRYYDDLAEADVAQILGVSPGAVKQHAARGLSRLRLVVDPPVGTNAETLP